MSRANKLLAVALVGALGATVGLWLHNRALRRDLDRLEALLTERPSGDPWQTPKATAAAPADRAVPPAETAGLVAPIRASGERPTVPEAPRESRLDRRVRRFDEIAATFGR